MNQLITIEDIKNYCGSAAYARGRDYYRSGRVKDIVFDKDSMTYEAIVRGSENYRVFVEFDDTGICADCDCPAYYSHDNFCKHIAALLCYIYEDAKSRKHPQHTFEPGRTPASAPTKRFSAESLISDRDRQLTRDILSLFAAPQPAALNPDTDNAGKQLLNVEYTFKTSLRTNAKSQIFLEMRLGVNRLYIVQNIKDFLSKFDNGLPYIFTKLFTFDLRHQTLRDADKFIVEQLVDIYRDESITRDATNHHSRFSSNNYDRSMTIPPQAWKRLLPLLSTVSAKFEYDNKVLDSIVISDAPLPIMFRLGKPNEEAYQLDIKGLDSFDVLGSYGYSIVNGKFVALDKAQLRKVDELKRLLAYAPEKNIKIPANDMNRFMEQVLPGLCTIGSIFIGNEVTQQIIQEPLTAKLYLDRDDDGLIIRLDYMYGGAVVNPLSAESESGGTEDIILRDWPKENLISQLIGKHPFVERNSRLCLSDEEQIYMFLYHTLPQLEQMSEIYATSSTGLMMQRDFRSPKASLELDEKNYWLHFDFHMDDISEADVQAVLRSLIEKKKYYRLPDGAYLSLEDERFQEIGRFIDDLGIRRSQIKGNRADLPVVHSLHFVDAKENTPGIRFGKSLRELLDNVKNPENLEFKIPNELSPVLRDYQKYGFQWMKTLAHYGFGGILADDMGLGKTIQSIGYILSEKEESRAKDLPSLIVAPSSLVYNWKNEFMKFAPSLKAAVVDGSKSERRGILDGASDIDVLITSYPLIRRDIELYSNMSFHALILDEAQNIKNHETQTAQNVNELQAKNRFALTGTPIENRLEELWSIYNAVFPGLFNSLKNFSELSRQQIAQKIRPFLLRRMKSDVLQELPEKIETLHTSELTSEQKKLYLAYLSRLQSETVKDLRQDGFQRSRMKILAGLTRLRQLCCHPALFVENYRGDSGKMEQLMEILEECLSGQKRVLLFSQFTEMLAIIRNELGKRSMAHFYLDGKTPSAERVELSNRFNQGENSVFLISLKAGGTGLNLTGADTVILYDLWWNPAVEQQAADRAHRIGQKKVVQVIRLITQGTIEEKMYELQQKKKDMINEVIQPGEGSLSTLSEQDIREILMIGK